MTDSNVQDHITLLRGTGRHRLTAEQLEIIRKIEHGGPVLELEDDDEPTLDLRR